MKFKLNYLNWIAAATELLSATVNNLVKTNTEFRNAKSDLTNTRTDLTNKLAGILNYFKNLGKWNFS